MGGDIMANERRKYPRYRVNDNAFALINSEPVKLFRIIDIAMGGIGIYVDDTAQWTEVSASLEIMAADCSFYMENLPYELISDSRGFSERPSNLVDGRRFSLRFGKLMNRQQVQLKYFIRNYTDGRVMLQLLQRLKKMLHPFRTPRYAAQSCNTGMWQGLHRPTY
jgi:hypothetical protein